MEAAEEASLSYMTIALCDRVSGFLTIAVIGGERGIRTPDTRKGMADFESAAFNRALPSLRFESTTYDQCFCPRTTGDRSRYHLLLEES